MGLRSALIRLSARAVVAIVQARGRAIRPEGQAALLALAEAVIRARDRLLVSEQIGILAGFDREVLVDDGVASAFGLAAPRQILAVVNHFADCPVGVVSNAVFTAHGLKKTFGVEPTVIFGMGASVVTLLRERVSRVTDIVMVGGLRIKIGQFTLLDMRNSSSAEILGRLRGGESVIIYPEKTNSSALLRGDFRSGRIILHCAELGVPIVPVAIHFSNGVFRMGIGQFLDQRRVLAKGASHSDKQLSGQAVVDYAMDAIARQLPEALRGAYGTQRFVAACR